MADLVRSVTYLTARIRERCDQTNSDFVTDAWILNALNASLGGLIDEVLEVGGPEAFLSSYTGTTVAGTASYNVSATGGPSSSNDVLSVAGVDVQFAGEWRSIDKWSFDKRTALEGESGWGSSRDTFYRVGGRSQGTGVTSITFYPTPSAAVSFRVWYLPIAHDLTAGSDVVAPNSWEEYLVCDVCAMIAEREESDAGPWIARREQARARIRWRVANDDETGINRIRETVDWGDVDPHDFYEPLV